MGLHATIFSPAKYGIVPEMLAIAIFARQRAARDEHLRGDRAGNRGGGVLFAIWKAGPVADGRRRWRHRCHRPGRRASDHARAGLRRHADFSTGTPSARSRAARATCLTTSRCGWRCWRRVLLVCWRAAQDEPAVLRQRRPEGRAITASRCCGPFSRSVSAQATCWPGASPATRWNSGWCRWRDLHGLSSRSPGGRAALASRSPRRRWCCLAMASGLFVVPLYAYIQQRSDSARKRARRSRDQQFLQDDRHAARRAS